MTSWIRTNPSTEELKFDSPSKWNSYENLEHCSRLESTFPVLLLPCPAWLLSGKGTGWPVDFSLQLQGISTRVWAGYDVHGAFRVPPGPAWLLSGKGTRWPVNLRYPSSRLQGIIKRVWTGYEVHWTFRVPPGPAWLLSGKGTRWPVDFHYPSRELQGIMIRVWSGYEVHGAFRVPPGPAWPISSCPLFQPFGLLR